MVVRLTEKADDCWAQLVSPRKWTPEKIAVFHEALTLIPSDKCTEKWKVGYCHWASVCDGCHLEVSQVLRESQRLIMLNISKTQPIYGIQWRCKVCESFNFCFKYAWTRKFTHPHYFETLPEGQGPETQPVPRLGEERPSLGKAIVPVRVLLYHGSIHLLAWAGRYRHAMTTCVRIAYLTEVSTKISLYRGCPRLWHRLLFSLTA